VTLEPQLQAGEWVFVTVAEVPSGTLPLASFREAEGVSVVLERGQADALGLSYDFVGAWISLGMESALDEVGLTAAVTGRLAAAGISCNVIAARHHDHLIVPHDQAERAVGLLADLSR
jgi:hypothetical protein